MDYWGVLSFAALFLVSQKKVTNLGSLSATFIYNNVNTKLVLAGA